MFDWISRNSEILNVILNAGMLAIWMTYLQVFVSSYRRQTRAGILINMGSGEGIESRCLVSNMSTGPVYLQTILLDLDMPDGRLRCPVTELDGIEEWETPSEINLWTRQGPLDAGSVRDMGPFRVLIDHALRSQPQDWQEAHADAWERLRGFEVRVMAIYAAEDLPVGAERSFRIRRSGGQIALCPEAAAARQIRSRRERRAMQRALEGEVSDMS